MYNHYVVMLDWATEEDLGIKFTDEEWENQEDGRICRGGFGEWVYEI